MTGIDDAVAVVGLAGRFPGAASAAELWANVRGGVETVSFFSDDELIAEGVEADVVRDPDYVPARGVLADWDRFDSEFFAVSARDAELMDPQHRLFLETAWSALEDAALVPDAVSGRVGVYAGASSPTYLLDLAARRPEMVRALRARGDLSLVLGNGADFLATRVAYKLGLTGPAVTVQTGCSTSLVAVHQACQALLGVECDVAIAGGSSVAVPHGVGYLYREGGPQSQDGHCRAFDATSTGTVGGSGVAAVVLKRWSDAVADGDHVYAAIRGSAVNNDGAAKVGFTAPSVDGQAAVVAEALDVAGIDAGTIGLVEAHGTGTALGDPIEVAALTQAWRRSTEARGFCVLGSVKTNVGHLDAAAGITGLIKAVLAVAQAELPPSLHFRSPNPELHLETTPFRVGTQLDPWAGTAPRRAAVSSFGMGGTNAHVVIEQAPDRPAATGGVERPELLPISARSLDALRAVADRLADRLAAGGVSLVDAATTWQRGRAVLPYRLAVVAPDLDGAVAALRSPQPTRERAAGRSPVTFAVDDADDPHRVLQAARSWAEWGVRPDAAAGVGEGCVLAAALAGVIGHDDAVALLSTGAAVRGPALHRVPLGAARIPCWSPSAGRWILGDEARRAELWAGPPVSATPVAGPGTDHVVLRLAPPDAAALAELWSGGVDVDWSRSAAGASGRRVPLPTYPFGGGRFRLASGTPDGAPAPGGPVPGVATARHPRPDLSVPYAVPSDDLERAVVEVWQDVLEFDGIGVDDDFYDLGGDSIAGVDVVGGLGDLLGGPVAIERVMEEATPRGQAALLRGLLVEHLDALSDGDVERLLDDPGDRR